MHTVFSKLDIPREIRSFLALTDDSFYDYGDGREYFDARGYRVPSTRNIWVGGHHQAACLIIAYSVIEAVAMLTINFQRFGNLEDLAVVALGTRVRSEQMDWIRMTFPGRKVILAFGNDLAARLTDIRAAAWLQQHLVHITYHDQLITISKENATRYFDAASLSLSAYKRAFGIRNHIRTIKPRRSNTFLEQITHDAAQGYSS